MPRVKRTPAPPPAAPRMPDRPGRMKLLLRRQRRLLRPAALASILLVAGIGVLAVVHAIGQGAPLRERLGRATAELGLRVQDVVIEGRQKTPEPMLRAALGVARGDPILAYSVADARARVETLTWVQSASVARVLPSTIVVRLTERRPFAVWQNQGKFALIDRAGEIVADSDVATLARELPLVVGAGAPQAAAGLLDALAQQPALLARVTAIVRVGERRWNLRLNTGTDVLLPEGAERQALSKLAELQADHALLDRPLQVVDLRFSDHMIVRPRPDSTAADKAAVPPPPPRKPS